MRCVSGTRENDHIWINLFPTSCFTVRVQIIDCLKRTVNDTRQPIETSWRSKLFFWVLLWQPSDEALTEISKSYVLEELLRFETLHVPPCSPTPTNPNSPLTSPPSSPQRIAPCRPTSTASHSRDELLNRYSMSLFVDFPTCIMLLVACSLT